MGRLLYNVILFCLKVIQLSAKNPYLTLPSPLEFFLPFIRPLQNEPIIQKNNITVPYIGTLQVRNTRIALKLPKARGQASNLGQKPNQAIFHNLKRRMHKAHALSVNKAGLYHLQPNLLNSLSFTNYVACVMVLRYYGHVMSY